MSSVRITSIEVCVPTAISCEAYPINEITRRSWGLAFKENFPSLSVVAPVVVPLIRILTPGNPWPVGSLTVPVICSRCAFAVAHTRSSITATKMFR
jgi:hypothetical protein